MRTADTIYYIINIIDEGIVNNNADKHYILFMEMIDNFVLESGKIHFDYQFDLLNKANYIFVGLYETSNKEFKIKKDYYENRNLILENLSRIEDDKNLVIEDDYRIKN